MERFVTRHRSLVTCVLSGFDRLVFRGTLIPLVRDLGMYTLLTRAGVRLLDFKSFALRTSERVKEASLLEVRRARRPIRYIESSRLSKEDLARQLLREHPTERGVVCAMTAVEPCMSFEYHLSQDRRERGLKLRPRKCLHIYKYYLHPRLGLINARIQTWFPFNIQICMNGREWLARQLTRRRSGFQRHDNCFTQLSNPTLAQELMDEQLETDWPSELTAIARKLNPLHEEIFRPWPQDDYWSTYQSEWATDLLFESQQALASIYPGLVRHATLHFQSPDVMRFLGRKGVHGRFEGELTSSFKRRCEGVRVKHWVNGSPHVRRVLVEAAWSSRLDPKLSLKMQRRCQGLSPAVVAIADKARRRQHKRFWHLVQRGKSQQAAVVACARELIGFVWAIARQVRQEQGAA